MLILQDAFQIALEFIETTLAERSPNVEIVIMACEETEHGWMFDFESRDFVEGKTSTKWIIGSGPIMVPKSGEPPFYMTVFDYFALKSDDASEHSGDRLDE